MRMRPVSDERPPRTIGRYELHGVLASGGMARVHFGRVSGAGGFSRPVAIKRLHPQLANDPEFVTMFVDEARLCGRIRHPNVVATLDVVKTDDELFIVMEYIAGETLSKLLRLAAARSVPTSPKIVASIVASVLHGLHAAHHAKDERGRELGIVHRDVSPQNILVGADGAARLLDFGIAKAAGRLQTTRDGQVKGKVGYMPPEQLSGDPVTPQVDIYAASVVLWEALVGRKLFDGETEAAVFARAVQAVVPTPSSIDRRLGPEVDALVLRGLARAPSERYATAREMALDLEQTMGVASPWEVAAWVDAVAGDELRRRAEKLADMELSSTGSSDVVVPVDVTSELPTAISTISVSCLSVPVPSRARRGAWAFALAAGALVAASSAGAALLATPATAARRGRAEPELETRAIAIERPKTAPAKAAAEPPRAQGHPAVVRHKPTLGCEPPFTIDPTTGHKKYRLECLR